MCDSGNQIANANAVMKIGQEPVVVADEWDAERGKIKRKRSNGGRAQRECEHEPRVARLYATPRGGGLRRRQAVRGKWANGSSQTVALSARREVSHAAYNAASQRAYVGPIDNGWLARRLAIVALRKKEPEYDLGLERVWLLLEPIKAPTVRKD